MGIDDEQRFVKKYGRRKADALQKIWQNSFPTQIWGRTVPKHLSKDNVFALNAKEAGYSKVVIEGFLKLGRRKK